MTIILIPCIEFNDTVNEKSSLEIQSSVLFYGNIDEFRITAITQNNSISYFSYVGYKLQYD